MFKNNLQLRGHASSGAICLALLCGICPAYAASDFDWYGDFRVRLEADWDSHRDNGIERDDRVRARIRLRGGVKYKPSKRWEFGARIRTGADDNQQSGHITIKDFSGNRKGDSDVNFDKWYAKYKMSAGSFWVGRNSYPFWRPNNLFWDDDVTPAGGALSLGQGEWQFNLAYMALPVGLRNFSGYLGGVQTKYEKKFDDSTLSLAAAYLNINGDVDDRDGSRLLQGNGARDYELIQSHLQYKLTLLERPLVVGFDYSHNFKHYNDPEDEFAFSHRGQRDAIIFSSLYGAIDKAGDWRIGYFYAHVEALSADSSYTQDDWLRFGGSGQTRSTAFKGHEFQLSYAISSSWNIVSRLFLVKTLQSNEDGKRFRMDFNRRF